VETKATTEAWEHNKSVKRQHFLFMSSADLPPSSGTVLLKITRRPASADRTARAANFRQDLEAM